ncbi:MAG: carbohydrate kinase family protein [Candidatus Hodarchaeota archaeon]
MQTIDPEKILAKIKRLKATVLPDFYLDIIVDPQMSFEELMTQIDTIYSRGGGNLLGPEIQFIPGGNGGNVARTLGKLGVPTSFITETSTFGASLIEFFMHPLGIKTSISKSGFTASSLILEIPHVDSGKSNVMLSSAGSVVDFSPDKLTSEQWNILRNSTIIAITNAQNMKMEELVETILDKTPPSVKISIDFSDLAPHVKRIDGFRKRIFEHPVRSPSLVVGNESEICLLANQPEESPEKAIKNLSKTYPETLFGLHTARKAEIWINGDRKAIEPSFKVSVRRATGAGDAWHAGFILGWCVDLTFSEVAKFANATAAQCIAGNNGSLHDIIKEIYNSPSYTFDK